MYCFCKKKKKKKKDGHVRYPILPPLHHASPQNHISFPPHTQRLWFCLPVPSKWALQKCWDTALTTVLSFPPLSGCLTWEKLFGEGNHRKNWMAIEWLPASSQTPACQQELGPPLPPLACHDFTLHDNPSSPTLTPPPQDDQASVRQPGWLSFLLLPWVRLLPDLLLATPPLSSQTSPQKPTDLSPTEGTPCVAPYPSLKQASGGLCTPLSTAGAAAYGRWCRSGFLGYG